MNAQMLCVKTYWRQRFSFRDFIWGLHSSYFTWKIKSVLLHSQLALFFMLYSDSLDNRWIIATTTGEYCFPWAPHFSVSLLPRYNPLFAAFALFLPEGCGVLYLLQVSFSPVSGWAFSLISWWLRYSSNFRSPSWEDRSTKQPRNSQYSTHGNPSSWANSLQ